MPGPTDNSRTATLSKSKLIARAAKFVTPVSSARPLIREIGGSLAVIERRRAWAIRN